VALAKRGITVNAISPGWIEDSVLNTLPDAVQDMVRDWHKGGWTPMGRLGTPADIGNAVALLCSEEAGWITGQVIAVDGGSSLMDPGLPLEIQRGLSLLSTHGGCLWSDESSSRTRQPPPLHSRCRGEP